MRASVQFLVVTFFAVVIVGASFGLGRPKANSASTFEPADAKTVTLKDFAFAPKTLRVKAGTAVTWRNAGGIHTITADDGSFRSPTLSAGQTFNFTFAKPGTYKYFCSFHGRAGGHDMAGSVVVSK